MKNHFNPSSILSLRSNLYLSTLTILLFYLFMSGFSSYACTSTGDEAVAGVSPSPYPLKVTQPDGSTITVLGKGNKQLSYTETVDGFTITKNQQGIYEYADQAADGSLKVSGVKAKDIQNRTIAEAQFLGSRSKHVRLSPAKAQQIMNVQGSSPSGSPSQAPQAAFPAAGARKVLMLLIKYPDMADTYTPGNFHDLMNKSNYNGTGSFKDYYMAASFGALNLSTDVYGWYTATHNYSYYGDENGDTRARELVREAVDAAQNAGVDFSQYDNDGNGYVDGIIAVHAGPGAEEGSQTQYIWSHRWSLYTSAVQYDGVWIDDYMINPERRTYTNSMVGIGIFCHEFGHGLGLPDLYDIDDSNGDSEGVGNWCLMGGGSWLNDEKTPAMMSAGCKEHLGWVSPAVISNSGTYMLAWAANNSSAYRINTPVANEYFLIENRQKTGFDAFLPGEGLAIWHINKAVYSNANENMKLVDLEEADGFNDLDNQMGRGDNGDLYPGTSNNRDFTNTSSPDSKNYNGNSSGVNIVSIMEQTGMGVTDNVSFSIACTGNNQCNDSDVCTDNACVNGVCAFTPVVCDDSNACTYDDCANGQCVFTAISCSDGSICVDDTCVNGECISTLVSCDDQDVCTDDLCDVMNGCLHTPNGNCADSVNVAGMVVSETGAAIPDATVHLTGASNDSKITGNDGAYNFDAIKGDSYAVTPSKDDSPASGCISTLDLLLMQSHILALHPLNSPYKIIAADVNGSGSVTTMDIIHARAIVLGTASTFPSGKAWEFVSSDFVFTDPLNPFPFESSRTYDNITSSYTGQDFIGVRLGDVNGSCDASLKMNATREVKFSAGEHHATSGDEITVPVKVKDFKNIAGYQFTVSWDAEVLSLMEVNNKSVSGYYGKSHIDAGQLTVSWIDEAAKSVTLDDESVIFELKFRVTGKSGSYSDIKIGSELVSGEAYDADLQELSLSASNGMVKVGVSTSTDLPVATGNLQVHPNPFSHSTSIGWMIPADSEVSVTVYDQFGRVIKRLNDFYNAGSHRIAWDGDDDNGVGVENGIYHVTMTAGNQHFSKKVVLTR